MEIKGSWSSTITPKDFIDTNDLSPLIGRWGTNINVHETNPYVISKIPITHKDF